MVRLAVRPISGSPEMTVPMTRARRASRRSAAASSLRRRATLSAEIFHSAVSQLLAGGRSAPGGAPAPPGCEGANLARGRRTGRGTGITGRRPPKDPPVVGLLLRFVPPSRRLMRAPLDGRGRADDPIDRIACQEQKTNISSAVSALVGGLVTYRAGLAILNTPFKNCIS